MKDRLKNCQFILVNADGNIPVAVFECLDEAAKQMGILAMRFVEELDTHGLLWLRTNAMYILPVPRVTPA